MAIFLPMGKIIGKKLYPAGKAGALPIPVNPWVILT